MWMRITCLVWLGAFCVFLGALAPKNRRSSTVEHRYAGPAWAVN